MPSSDTSLPRDDETAIRAIMARHAAAWNAHDMDALVADVAPEVVWINVVGMRWEGREQVRRAHEALHRAPMFAHSRVHEVSVDLRPVAPDLVIGISRTAMEGAGPTPDGRPYPAGGSIMTLLYRRDRGIWRIAHAHNTNVDATAAPYDPSRARVDAG